MLGASQVALVVKKPPAGHRRRGSSPWVGKIPCRRARQPTPGEETGDAGSIPGPGSGTPLQCSCLENPIDRGTWQATAHGVTNSWTQMSDKHFHFHFIIVKLFIVEKNKEII